MTLRVADVVRLPVPAAALGAVLDDPERLAAALPHVDDFVADGPGAFSCTIRPATALGEVPFATAWSRTAHEPGRRVGYEVRGRFEEHLLELRADVALAEEQPEVTTVAWTAECAFTGTMRAVGQRVLPAVVRHQVDLVLAAAAAQAAAGVGGEAA